MSGSGFGFGSRSVYLDRAVYTTITIMSVLIVHDGWQNLKFWAAVGVIAGPVLAMFVSHVFSAFLAGRQTGRQSCTSVPAAASRCTSSEPSCVSFSWLRLHLRFCPSSLWPESRWATQSRQSSSWKALHSDSGASWQAAGRDLLDGHWPERWPSA
jgi:hypothetical protein